MNIRSWIIRYWIGGATIRRVVYKANSEDAAIKKFRRYRDGEILGIEEA